MYSTGVVDENGKEILENAVVPVSATCTRSTAPKISALSGPNIAVRLLFNTSGSVAVTFSNQGNAPLEYSSSVATGTLDPDASVTVQVPVYCGWLPGDQDVPFYVYSNDPDLGQRSILITVHCYGDIITHNSFIVAGSKKMVYTREIIGLLDTTGCAIYIDGTFSLYFPSVAPNTGFPFEIGTSHDPLKTLPPNYHALVRTNSPNGIIDSILRSFSYGTSYFPKIYLSVIPSNYGIDTNCEHPPLPIDLFNEEAGKLSSEIDNALTLWQSSTINDPKQTTTLTNIRKISSSDSTLYGFASHDIFVYADVIFSFK